MKKLMLLIGQAEPDDTLNTMTELGLEFAIVSSETDIENASTEVTVETADVNAFVQKVESIFVDLAYKLEMLTAVIDIETGEPVFEQ